MASRDEQEAAVIRPPRKGECRQFQGSATTQVFATPADWYGKKVRFTATGDDFWIQTGPDIAISITPTAVDTIGAQGVLSAPNNAIGEKVLKDTFVEYDFYKVKDAFVGFRGTGTAGLLAARPSEVSVTET